MRRHWGLENLDKRRWNAMKKV